MDEPQSNTPEKSPEPEEAAAENKIKQSEPDVQTNKKNKEKNKKKDTDRSAEVLKALSTLGTNEEKLAAMCKKYADMVDENRKLQAQVKQTEKRVLVVQREKEQLQMEHSKAILTRSRLENLCRELQKQNKQIKDESLQRIREEEERRKAVSNKFQNTLGEITVLMQQNNENNSKLRDENLEMQNKFKTVCEQYELREQQVEKMSKQMQLESQLAEAKLTKLKIEMVSEKERLENDKKQLLIELAAYQQKCEELQNTEATLNSQINMYNEKFDKFQEALVKSNKLYFGFKGEINKMSKKIAKLEKETSVWKTRWETDHQSLLQVAAEKQQLTKQLNQLQKLCRTLQSDRTSLLSQLKSEGIAPKLSGDRNSAEPASQEPETKVEPTNSATEIVASENGNKEKCDEALDQETMSADRRIKDEEKEVTAASKKKAQALVIEDGGEGDVPQKSTVKEQMNDRSIADKKGKETSNMNSNATPKTKKGREGSKKR